MTLLYCFDEIGYLNFNPYKCFSGEDTVSSEKYKEIFDENGNIKSSIKNGLEHIIFCNDFDYDSDAVKLVYALSLREEGLNGWEKDVDLFKYTNTTTF